MSSTFFARFRADAVAHSLDRNDVLDLCWSEDAQTLAVATSERVTLHCAQRLDDLSGNPSWITYASISDSQYAFDPSKLPVPAADSFSRSLTASPLSAICWFSKGFAVAYGDHVFFHSSKLTTGEDCHAFAAERLGPLPNHHPQLLFQSLLHGASPDLCAERIKLMLICQAKPRSLSRFLQASLGS